MRPIQQIDRFLSWLEAVGVDRYDLAVSWRSNGGRFIPGLQDTDIAGVERSLPWQRHSNAAGADIYVRPARGPDWPLVFLDDVGIELARRIAKKYRAAVVETSPGNCQIWLALTSTQGEEERKVVQQWLTARIGSDPGSVSGEHYVRLPGFRNRKPRRDAWVNLIVTSIAPAYDPTQTLAEAASRFSSHDAGVVLQRRNCTRAMDRGLHTVRDESRMEFGWAVGALRHGMDEDVVLRRLIGHASPRRGPDAERYARHTLKNALRALGR